MFVMFVTCGRLHMLFWWTILPTLSLFVFTCGP